MTHADRQASGISNHYPLWRGERLLTTAQHSGQGLQDNRSPDRARLRAWLSLLRLRTTLSAPLLTALGVRAVRPGSVGYDAWHVILECATAFFTITFAQVINDIVDRHNDAKHKPCRAIPSGMVSVRAASLATVLCAAMGLMTAALVGLLTVGIAALILAIGIIYSAWLKNTVLCGNVAVAMACGLLYLLDLRNWRTFNWLFLEGSLIVFLFILGAEIFKTAEDKEGDAINGIRTIATRYGLKASSVGVACCCALLVAVCLANFLVLPGELSFGAISLAVIGLPTVVASVTAFRASPRSMILAHRWWNISWIPGLVALAYIR